MLLVGVKKSGPSTEWAIPLEWRARWLRDGGRILREQEGEHTGEPVPLASLPSPAPGEPKRRPGRPPGSKTRRGSLGGDAAIVERID